MRYDDTHRAKTRARVLAEAAAAIRSKGVERVGVAEVMAVAGLTHGGFDALQVALSAGPGCRATARGAVRVFSPSRIVVGGGDSGGHASVAASDRVMVISNRSFGTRAATVARPRLRT